MFHTVESLLNLRISFVRIYFKLLTTLYFVMSSKFLTRDSWTSSFATIRSTWSLQKDNHNLLLNKKLAHKRWSKITQSWWFIPLQKLHREREKHMVVGFFFCLLYFFSLTSQAFWFKYLGAFHLHVRTFTCWGSKRKHQIWNAWKTLEPTHKIIRHTKWLSVLSN